MKINLEACDEIAAQLRLRNLSGMILIDFINQKQEASRQAILERLRYGAAGDPGGAAVIDMTRLGLVEMTRKKIRKNLAEQIASCGLRLEA